MVNSVQEVLIFATPAVASAAVAGSAWWARPRTCCAARRQCRGDLRRPGGRTAVDPGALAAAISIAIGALAYGGRAIDVSSGQALHGAVVALLASAVALGAYWALGVVARRLVTLAGLWAASLVPLYFYAFWAWLVVAGYTQCGPQAYECPL